MTVLDFVGATLTGAVLFGQLLLLLVIITGAFCTFLVCFIANDIWKTIRIKKERRGVH